MHYLITGHTGFKGTWLSLMLHSRGHSVSGLSLAPVSGALYEVVGLGRMLKHDIRCDIRDYSELVSAVVDVNPDVVIHLAAQSLVRESYKDPATTFEINTMGTLNVLRAAQNLKNLQAMLIITTDKVYRNIGKKSGYIESDPLGGDDPYSASKAMADIATQSWLKSVNAAPTGIARAGNVIGGGDVCLDRLIPDLVKSHSTGQLPRLRAPNSIRPWQHVLDCLNGYLLLVEHVRTGKSSGAWNFGPDEYQSKTVAEVTELVGQVWGVEKAWEQDSGSHPHEAEYLTLNSKKAQDELGWRERMNFTQSVTQTIDWYRSVSEGADPLTRCLEEIRDFDNGLVNL